VLRGQAGATLRASMLCVDEKEGPERKINAHRGQEFVNAPKKAPAEIRGA
jgi:hypothetical protein